jgi:uncharacterized membrane protein
MLAVTTSRLEANVLRIMDSYSTIYLASVIACIYCMRSIYEMHEMEVVSIRPSIPSSMPTLKFRNHLQILIKPR